MRVLRGAIIATMLMIGISLPVDALAQEVMSVDRLTEKEKGGKKTSTTAAVRKFDLFNNELLNDYNKASAAEFQFYKEDLVSEKMERLFTDDTSSIVNPEFSTEKALNELEKETKDHPLYEQFKDEIADAKTLLSGSVIETPIADSKVFNHYTNQGYTDLFQMDYANIKSIRNNGKHYGSAVIKNAIDKDLKTYWETNTPNTANFTNEVELEFKEAVEIDRLIYGARHSDNKGFAEQFEIYGSETSEGDTYELVSTGQHKMTSGLVEVKFKSTKLKRIKFIFKKSNQNWATLSELAFYKEDTLAGKMEKLFTDEHQNKVSAEYNTLKKLGALEESVKAHPLYKEFKEDLKNAKVLLEQEEIKATQAKTRPFDHYTNEAYSKLFRMDLENVKSIRNNAGHHASQVIGHAVDGKLDTYWETNKGNSANFSNEVEIEFKEAVELNRLMYGARKADRKGFAEEFEIYASQTSKGDTYHLVSTGGHAMVAGLVEAKFEPTTFKRVKFKFKRSNQNWATLSELAFYKEDSIQDKVDHIFTDGTMSAVVPAFNSIDKLNALEKEAKTHPLYSILKEKIELAKKIVSGEVSVEGNIVNAEQRGNMKQHATQNLRMPLGTNNQPTGMAAMSGNQITVYVEADSNSKLPSLIFTQQEGSWSNWERSVQLTPGKNTITVPEIPTDGNYAKKVTKGGPIYIVNPYTSEEQGKAPVIRFEGTERIPLMTGDTDPESFKDFLTEYKQRIDEDKAQHPNVEHRALIDVVEMASEHIMFTGSTTAAHKAFITNGNNPMDTIKGYDVWMKQIFDFYGLDGRSNSHDPKRIRENIRVMQPWGFMYAAYSHTGIQPGQESLMFSDFRKVYPGWGLNHEIGHRMDIGEREYGEVTNNMLSMGMSIIANSLDNRIPFENEIYKNVIEENKLSMKQFSGAGQLAVYWQLELAHPGYWEELNGLYRERKVSLPNGDNSKQQYLIEFSSEILGMDLSSYFARHGFTVNPETKEKVSKYPAPKKLWYLNNTLVGYEGKGLNKNTAFDVSVRSDAEKKTNNLTFMMDKENKNDLLGYEVYRDGKLVGFTSTDQFADKDVDASKNYTYRVIAFDKKLNTLDPVEFKAFKPSMSVEEYVTLKLHQKFDPMDYVKAISSTGEDITEDVVVKSSTVDVTKKGLYQIVYEVTNREVTATNKTKVTVTSDYTYVSDMDAKSANIQYGGLKKDTATPGTPITLVRQGLDAIYAKGIGAHANSEVVYDIDGEGFDFFESYIGIDQVVKGEPSSATFEVWVDGEKKFASNVFKSETEHEFVKVPVTGAKEVKLITTDAKQNGNTGDHTVWAEAKFTLDSSKPILKIPKSVSTKVGTPIDLDESYEAFDQEDGDLTEHVKVIGIDQVNFNQAGRYLITYSVTDSDGNEVSKNRIISVVSMDNFTYLSDYDWNSTSNSYSEPVKDLSTSSKPLRLTDENGKEVIYKKGLGTHANTTIVYDLTGMKVAYLTSFVGVDRQMFNTAGSVEFQVYVDGKKEYDSGLMRSIDPQKHFELDLAGATELKIVVTDGGNGIGSDHATWGDTKLYFANTKSDVDTAELSKLIEKAKTYKQDGYTEKTYTTLQNAINKAETVVENATTEKEVEEGIKQLQQAIDALEKVVDTSKLTELIEQAKTYKQDGYTEKSYAALQKAINEAESVVKNAKTQKEITIAIDQLQETMDGLEKALDPKPEPEEVDTRELLKLIEHAKVYENKYYTDASFGALLQAINQAVTVAQNAKTQEEVSQSMKQLQGAMDGLERVLSPNPDPEPEKIDASELLKQIEHAKLYEQQNYTDASFSTLQQAISQAATVAQNATTQEKVSQAMKQLQGAMDGLERVSSPNPDPEPEKVDASELLKLIEHAKLYEQQNYTDASFSTLQQTINQATVVAQNATTQEEISRVITQLQQVIAGLERVVDPDPELEVNTTELSNLIIHAKTYEKDRYTASTYASLQQAISRAEVVIQTALAQEEIATATKQLQQVIVGLEKIVEPEPEPEPEVDPTELLKLISHAKTYEKGSYTVPSYAILQQAINHAEIVAQTATTREEVIAAIKQLQQGIARLEKFIEPKPKPEPEPEVDTTELSKLISHAKTYEEEHHTAASYAALQQAINQAETLVQTATTHEEIVAEITRLQQAISGLEVAIKPDPKPDPKPEPKPEPKPKPVSKPEPKPVSKPNPKPDPKPEYKPAPTPESKPTSIREYKSESKLVPIMMGDKKNSKPEYNLDSKTESNLGMNSKNYASKSSKSVDEEIMDELESEENADELDLEESKELDLEESFTDYEPNGELNKSVTEDKSSNKTNKDFSWVFVVLLFIIVAGLVWFMRKKSVQND